MLCVFCLPDVLCVLCPWLDADAVCVLFARCSLCFVSLARHWSCVCSVCVATDVLWHASPDHHGHSQADQCHDRGGGAQTCSLRSNYVLHRNPNCTSFCSDHLQTCCSKCWLCFVLYHSGVSIRCASFDSLDPLSSVKFTVKWISKLNTWLICLSFA